MSRKHAPSGPALRWKLVPVAVLAIAALSGACATASGGGGSDDGGDVLTAAELQGTGATNLLDAVRTLRPQWLRRRGPKSMRDVQGSGRPRVMVDGFQRGELVELRQISVSDVATVQFVGASEATTRWGTGFTGGAIVVSTRGAGS